MALARWQATIQDESGNILPGAEITVRREVVGAPLAVLYADRDGTVPLGNPFNADATDAFAYFYAEGGAYRIDATSGSFTAEPLRHVAVGLAAETDSIPLDISYLFDTTTTDGDPGAGFLRFDNATPASVTEIYVDNLDDLGADVSSWLDRVDDYGSSSDRGVLIIRALNGSAEMVAQVTGSVVDGSGYRTISVTPLATSGSFTENLRLGLNFTPRGAPGADGDIAGPGATTVARQFAVFSDGGGSSIEGGVTEQGSPTEPLTPATDDDVLACTPGKVFDSGHLRTASTPRTVTDAATIAFDWEAFENGEVTLGGNRTLGFPTNLQPGKWRTLRVTQDGTGSRTLSFASGYVFPGGTAPTLTTTAGADDRLFFFCRSLSVVEVYSSLNFGAS